VVSVHGRGPARISYTAEYYFFTTG
jgi:hypothetical protein